MGGTGLSTGGTGLSTLQQPGVHACESVIGHSYVPRVVFRLCSMLPVGKVLEVMLRGVHKC